MGIRIQTTEGYQHQMRGIAREFDCHEQGTPAGADPVWQPYQYLQGCSGWVATTGYSLGPNNETPWLIPLHRDPFSGLERIAFSFR